MWLAILSGILLALAYPVFNLEFLAFVAFVPLFFALKNKSLKQAFLLAFIMGIVFWAITIYWLIHVTLIGLILLVLYLSVYFGLFGLIFVGAPLVGAQKNRAGTRAPTFNVLFIPTAWVFLEFLRSRLITGFPWALLGYSQYLNLPFIQIVDIVGVWGVSFLVMMVNVVAYTVIARSERSERRSNLASGLLRRPFGPPRNDVLLLLILLYLSLSYGFYKLHLSPMSYDLHPIKVSLIQGNIPQHQKWDEDFRDSILERYETLTKEAARDNPDLIIWPETSVPGVVDEEPELLARILKLAKDVKTPILIGAVTSKSTTHNSQLTTHNYYNSALLISSNGKVLKQYDKLHLVPFGEYVPLESHFPFLRNLIGVPIGDFTAGKECTVFKLITPNSQLPAKFAVLICFEDIIPSLSRRFVKEGAHFLVNITNDAWFMKTSAPYQHVQASVFMAIENRVPVVRAANTGVSCFIDKNGRIYDKVMVDPALPTKKRFWEVWKSWVDKKDIFVVGYKTGEILLKIKNEK